MILIELIDDNGVTHRIANRTAGLTHKWKGGFVGDSMGGMGWSLPAQTGGLISPIYGGVVFSHDVLPNFPPQKRYSSDIYYTAGSEEDKAILFSGNYHLNRVDRSGADYSFYVQSSDNVKIDSAAWASIDDDSLVNVIAALCGADYLSLPVVSAYARNSSPNVTYTFTSEQVVLELIDNLCSFYNHLAYIKDSVFYLVDMFQNNGDIIDLGRNIVSSEIICFAPVNKLICDNGDDWDIVVAADPYGTPISVTPYHDTEANALVELNLSKTIVESDVARVVVPMHKLSSFPNPGQPVHWIDNDLGSGIEATISARDVQYDYTNETATIMGEGTVGAAPVD